MVPGIPHRQTWQEMDNDNACGVLGVRPMSDCRDPTRTLDFCTSLRWERSQCLTAMQPAPCCWTPPVALPAQRATASPPFRPPVLRVVRHFCCLTAVSTPVPRDRRDERLPRAGLVLSTSTAVELCASFPSGSR